jgi:hypothetical protein
MLSLANKPIMLSIIMLSVIKLSVIKLNVIMSSVVAPLKRLVTGKHVSLSLEIFKNVKL